MMNGGFTPQQLRVINEMIDARAKHPRHQSADHRDRGLNEIKITPGSASGSSLLTISGTSQWVREYEIITSLPSSPYDGQIVAYQSTAMATDGIVWHLRYNSASGSSYKWEYIGGAPWNKVVDTDENRASATYGDCATAGPILTVPLAGEYHVYWGADCRSSAGVDARAGLSINAGTPAAADTIRVGNDGGTRAHSSRAKVKTAAAGNTIGLLYASTGGVPSNFMDRHLTVIPVRVA